MDCVESSGIVNDSRSRPMRRVLSESWPISQARASPKVHIHLASGWAQSREALLESNIKLAPSKHFHPMAQLPNPDSVHLYICTYVLLDLHFSLPVITFYCVFVHVYVFILTSRNLLSFPFFRFCSPFLRAGNSGPIQSPSTRNWLVLPPMAHSKMLHMLC